MSTTFNKAVNGACGWTTLSAASQQSCPLPWRYAQGERVFRILFIFLILSSQVFAHDEIIEGHYTYGNEVSVFKACNSDKIFWLEGSGHIMSEIWQYAMKGEKPYTPIYLKFRGHEHFEETDGFQADYKFQMYVSEVKEYRRDISKACE